MSFYQKLFFPNQAPSCICSMCLYCIGNISNCSIKSCGRSWSAHEGTIYAYTKDLLEENCLSSNNCYFVKKKIPNQTPSCICSICLHWSCKVSNCSIQSCGKSWSAHKGTTHANTKAIYIIKKKMSSSHSCHFFIFFQPDSFMHMFNVSILNRQSIKMLQQKLW